MSNLEPLSGRWVGGTPRVRAMLAFLDEPEPCSIHDRVSAALDAYLKSMDENGYRLTRKVGP